MNHNKLVRDNILEILQEKKIVFSSHIASEKEYWEKLKEKLVEEVQEFIESEEREEIADVFEVLAAIIKYKDFSQTEIEKIQKEKKIVRGGFDKKIILEKTE